MRRMKQRFPHIVSTRQILQSARWSIEVILERVSSNVSCASQAKRPWIARESGDTQKSWTCWWQKPLGCTGEAQWHSRWEYPWMKHGETAGTGGNENMKAVGIVWVGTRDVYASDFGHMTHEDPWSLNPLPNHHKPPAKNWAQVNHEFDWICRIDWARTNQIIRLCVDRTGMFFLPLDYLQHYMA